MFTAIGGGVARDGQRYAVTVEFFDDRVRPMKKVATEVYRVDDVSAVKSLVADQLSRLAEADKIMALSIDVQGKLLGSI